MTAQTSLTFKFELSLIHYIKQDVSQMVQKCANRNVPHATLPFHNYFK